ncbi:MAG: hypothetical protein Q9208_001193 [Pyrenodesmia sp. 3 TL-2023]
MAEQDDINLADWDICMPLIGDAGHNAGFRIKNKPGETERLNTTGIERNGTAVLGRLYHVVHGFRREGRDPPATLIVFEWLLRPGPLLRRFREVNIEVIFAAHGLRPGMLPSEDLAGFDPAVVKIGPSVPLENSSMTYTVDKTSGGSFGLSVGVGGYATLEPKVHSETTKSGIQRIDYSVQAGYPFLKNKNSGPPNGVLWTFQENSTQESGLPKVIRTAVLLERYDDDFGAFEATIKTTSHISFMEDAKESLRRAVGKIPVDDPVIFDPQPRADIPHGGVVLSGDKSDLTDVENPIDFKNLKFEDLDKLIAIVPEHPKGSV